MRPLETVFFLPQKGLLFPAFLLLFSVTFWGLINRPWRAITLTVQFHLIGTMEKSVQGGSAEQLVGKYLSPFDDVQIAGTILHFGEWGEVFPNITCVVAIIDRLVHHSEILSIDGDSCRVHAAEIRARGKKP